MLNIYGNCIERQVKTPSQLKQRRIVILDEFTNTKPSGSTASSTSTTLDNSLGPLLLSPSQRSQKKQTQELKSIDFCSTAKGFSPRNSGPTEVYESLNLRNMNNLGEPNSSAICKQDLLSAISFDHTGDILAVGDQGGRIILFERIVDDKGQVNFDYFAEF